MIQLFVITMITRLKLLLLAIVGPSPATIMTMAQSPFSVITLTDEQTEIVTLPTDSFSVETTSLDTTYLSISLPVKKHKVTSPSIYSLPYSIKTNVPDWKRLWVNTAVFAGAFGGTLAVLQCLPEDATSWNRAAIQQVPPLKRWYRNIFVRDPEIDHDKFVFNYVLHPYAGAVYFMAARSAGFNFWRSFLYCSIISNIGWEFGVEAFMERPSYQDLVITPCVGSIIGEGFYRLKRHLVANDFRLWGSPVIGNIVAFFIDPVNELTGLFLGNNARHFYRASQNSSKVTSSLMPALINGSPGFTFSCSF